MNDSTAAILYSFTSEVDGFVSEGIDSAIDSDSSIETGVALLEAIREARRVLADGERVVEDFLADVLPGGGYGLEDGRRVDVKSSTASAKWDWPALLPVIVARALDERPIDPETGEVLESDYATVARVLSDCIGLTPSKAGRKGELEKRGIDPTEYVATTYGPKRIVLSAPASSSEAA